MTALPPWGRFPCIRKSLREPSGVPRTARGRFQVDVLSVFMASDRKQESYAGRGPRFSAPERSALRSHGSAGVQIGDSPLSADHEIMRVQVLAPFRSCPIPSERKPSCSTACGAFAQEIGCADVLQLITGAPGAIDGLMGEVPARQPDSETARAAGELIEVVRSYLK
jgi:hypothetical protein